MQESSTRRRVRILTFVAIGALVLAAGIGISALIASAGHFRWDKFYAWVLGPYAVLACILIIPWGTSGRRIASGCTTACIEFVLTYLMYRPIWHSTSSTTSLTFIFGPIAVFVSGLLLWGLIYAIGPTVARHLSSGNSS